MYEVVNAVPLNGLSKGRADGVNTTYSATK